MAVAEQEVAFFDYMKKNSKYPKFTGKEILPMNTKYYYVSYRLLDGFLGFIEPVKAVLLNRDIEWEEDLDTPVRMHNEIFLTKSSFYNHITRLYTSDKRPVHGEHLISYMDTVLLLGKGDDCYWFFWYDQDCSDCMVGRFKTEDTEEVVLEKFLRLAKSLSNFGGTTDPYRELPVNAIARF